MCIHGNALTGLVHDDVDAFEIMYKTPSGCHNVPNVASQDWAVYPGSELIARNVWISRYSNSSCGLVIAEANRACNITDAECMVRAKCTVFSCSSISLNRGSGVSCAGNALTCDAATCCNVAGERHRALRTRPVASPVQPPMSRTAVLTLSCIPHSCVCDLPCVA